MERLPEGLGRAHGQLKPQQAPSVVSRKGKRHTGRHTGSCSRQVAVEPLQQASWAQSEDKNSQQVKDRQRKHSKQSTGNLEELQLQAGAWTPKTSANFYSSQSKIQAETGQDRHRTRIGYPRFPGERVSRNTDQSRKE